MTFETVLRKISVASFVCGGLLLGSVSFVQSVGAQVDDQPDSIEEIETAPDNDLGISDSDRTTRLRELQSTILDRNTSPSALSQPEGSSMSEQMTPTNSSSEALPGDLGEAIAVALPVDDQLSVELMNDTGALMTYEVIGDTTRRELMAGESAMLQGISLPTTITLVRQDEGLIEVMTDVSEAGVLKVMVTPDATLDDTQGVMRIQEDGQVFVY